MGYKEFDMRLILLRHGETLWNIEKRLQGHFNSPLSKRGISQANAIKPLIQQLSPKTVISSDLGRAVQTAEIIGFQDPIKDKGLRELNMGEWSGRKKQELIDENPELYHAWRRGDYTPKGGENWHQFCQRVSETLTKWVKESNEDVLAVVHSGVIRAACHSFVSLSANHLLPATQGTVTIFNFEPNCPVKLEAYNLGGISPDIDVAD